MGAKSLAPAAPQLGEVVGDKFRVEAVLGEGGMGTVFAAHHVLLDQYVAVKLLSPELARQESVVARFLREAKAAARLRSEHVARIMDVGSLPGGQPYIVMELLEGEDLEQRLTRAGPLPTSDAVDFILHALEAMAHAHAEGIVHRDLKPANIILVDRPEPDTVKILDFGMLRILRATGDLTKLTTTGFLLGTPAYAAPEQIINPSTASAAADLYSLGVVAFEMLNGRRPFVGSVIEVLEAHLNDAPPKAGDLDGLETIVDALLAKDPERRPTAAELLQMLDARVRAQTTRPVISRAAPRKKQYWAALVALGMVLGIAGASAVAYLDPPVRETIDLGAPRTQARPPPIVVPRAVDEPEPEEDEPADSPRVPAASEPKRSRANRPPPAKVRAAATEPTAAAVESSPDLVVGKLRRISALLTASSDRLSAAELDAFENRYFALRSEARPPLDPERAKALAPKVIALEADLEERVGSR